MTRIHDLLDLPQVINHLTGARWCAENDDVWANMSMYRDTFGDGLWRNIPFDTSGTAGRMASAGGIRAMRMTARAAAPYETARLARTASATIHGSRWASSVGNRKKAR